MYDVINESDLIRFENEFYTEYPLGVGQKLIANNLTTGPYRIGATLLDNFNFVLSVFHLLGMVLFCY